MRLLALLALAVLVGCTTNKTSIPPSAAAPHSEPKRLDEVRLNEAKMLKEERRYLEAAAIYEEQAKLQPENAEPVARQAHMYSSQAREEKDPAKAKALHRRARALAEQAEKLGTDDPLTPLILASVQPDGSTPSMVAGAFSKHEQADQFMREGEEAFTRHDFGKARECYQKAYELEPSNFMAALWTGDAYFAARQLESACEWFRKAIVIEPDNETAHRYLGDALAKLGRREEALNEYITALLCQPYQRLTRQHFGEEMRARAVARGRMIPQFPAMQSKIEGKEVKIAYDPQWGAPHMAYNICAIGWRKKDFSAAYPQEKAPRRSLREEVYAIDGMLEVITGFATDSSEKADPALVAKWRPIAEGLERLKKDGLLEAYALLERPDEELIKDYAAYRTEHRDKLERYVRVYWCGFE